MALSLKDIKTPEVTVIRTGTANLASIVAGLKRAGAIPKITDEKSDIESARLVILPGVGSFGATIEVLKSKGIFEPVKKRIQDGLPTMAVCVGLQLLCRDSEESPGVEGLGIVPVSVGRFKKGVRIPQFGWNKVEPVSEDGMLKSGYAYFANSYRITETTSGWKPAFAFHGEKFVAAMEKGAVLACQFHPELSGKWGLELIMNWIKTGLK